MMMVSAERGRNDGGLHEGRSKQTKMRETHIRIYNRRIRHPRTPQRDIAPTQRDKATRRQANVMLCSFRQILNARSSGVENTLVQDLDVGTIDKAGVENGLRADFDECLIGELLEAVGYAGGCGVGTGEVVVEGILGGH